ncbi:long-chain-fatty-acid--CoA ligase 4-like [Clavelina lepadiformis]|uniref:long-chain-fatty-acid--CoA ligase 4-like n=1 Tax=Clavelina lepadiformis TaxID=159417 RepID=UPI0040438DB9
MDSPVKPILCTLQWLFGVVSFVPWILLERFIPPELKEKVKNMTRKLKAKSVTSDPASSYRCIESMDRLMDSAYDGHRTIGKVFEGAARRYAALPCLGTREFLSEEDERQPGGKVFKKAIFGDYKWETFGQVYERMVNFGRGLTLTGQKPKEKIALFLETRAEWMIAVHGCFRNNFPVVTVYATLGEEGISHALNETEVSHVITSATLYNTRLSKCLSNLPTVTDVIYVEDTKLTADVPSNVKLHPFKEIEKSGATEEGRNCERSEPNPDDLAIVMYTSGQSGDPKGVLINHSNFVAGMSGISTRVPDLNTSDVYIGYLPLAHVLELAAENIMICGGAKIGYSSPLTLSDRSSRIKKGSKGDASVLRPTLMAAVPEIVERMRKAIMQGVDEMLPPARKAFHWAYGYKLKQVERGYDTPLLNRVLFKKTKALLGGRLRALLSGGAPMDAQTQRFMNVCMCCPIGQGYGLTETCGATTVSQVLDDYSTGRVGPPLPCCEVKLVAWEEGGYSPSNKPHPQGEIHIGGPNITQGYFKKPEKTSEEFYVDDDGQRWFKTGDIGQIDDDGAIRIIDRKKDLVKLSHGEYLALGSIEAKLKANALIDNVWVYANGTQSYAIAFIVPNEKNLRNAIAGKGGNHPSITDLCKEDVVEKELKKAVQEASKIAKLQKFEIPQKIYIEPQPWLPEDGLITAAFKLKRKALENHYQEQIQALYANVNGN